MSNVYYFKMIVASFYEINLSGNFLLALPSFHFNFPKFILMKHYIKKKKTKERGGERRESNQLTI